MEWGYLIIGVTGVKDIGETSSVMHRRSICTVLQMGICTKKGRSMAVEIYIYDNVQYIEWLNVRRLNACGYQKNSNVRKPHRQKQNGIKGAPAGEGEIKTTEVYNRSTSNLNLRMLGCFNWLFIVFFCHQVMFQADNIHHLHSSVTILYTFGF